jgi:hypothetical protein
VLSLAVWELPERNVTRSVAMARHVSVRVLSRHDVGALVVRMGVPADHVFVMMTRTSAILSGAPCRTGGWPARHRISHISPAGYRLRKG